MSQQKQERQTSIFVLFCCNTFQNNFKKDCSVVHATETDNHPVCFRGFSLSSDIAQVRQISELRFVDLHCDTLPDSNPTIFQHQTDCVDIRLVEMLE